MSSFERLSRPAVVVVANDQEWAARSLESLLGPRGFAVLRVSSGRQVLDLVRTAQPDALILDSRTQDLSAIEICRTLRADASVSPAMPVIITANDGGARADRLEAFSVGAWDYCVQPIDGEVLLLKLSTFLRAKQALDRVRDESLIDDTTGLYTLRGLARRAQELGAQAGRRRQAMTCIAFAPQRESDAAPEPYSARATASVVEQVAQACRSRGRTSDVFGRMGTSEFAVLAPATDDRGAARLLARLQTAVSEGPADRPSEPGPVRLLAGVSSVADFSVANIDVMDMLMRATDELRRLRSPIPDSTH